MRKEKFDRLSRGMLAVLAMTSSLVAVSACGKKKSKDSTDSTTSVVPGTPGVSTTDSNTLTLTGQLALPASLLDTTKGVLAFNMASGKVVGQPQVIEPDADGKFSLGISRADEAVDLVLAEMEKSPDDRDWESMFTAVKKITDIGSMTLEQLKAASDDEINQGITEIANSLKDAGAMSLLVSYDVSGDVEAEASSFSFIGLPTEGGKSLNGLPNSDLKGSVDFGQITGADGEASAEVTADEALDLSSEAIESLADIGKALRMVKNSYMNTNWSVQPFYFWKSNVTVQDVIGKFSDISKNTYKGYGFYVPSTGDQGLTYDDLCGGKTLTFTPPKDISEVDDSGNKSTVKAYSNAGATKESQGDNRICTGSGYYAREDVRDGETSFMLNFGTGGSIQDSPAGLWRMKIGGKEVGRFDLALASPVVDGHPTVLLPQVKFVKTGANITSAVVELYRWNGSAYEQVTDMAPVKKLFSEFSASITRTSDNGESRMRLTVNDDGTIDGKFDGLEMSDGKSVNPAVAASDVSSFAVYYNIGAASYRMEFR